MRTVAPLYARYYPLYAIQCILEIPLSFNVLTSKSYFSPRRVYVDCMTLCTTGEGLLYVLISCMVWGSIRAIG